MNHEPEPELFPIDDITVIEGEGTSVINEQEFHWSRGDVFVVPGWNTHAYKADSRSYLLRVTDEPVMKRFNWLRQEA